MAGPGAGPGKVAACVPPGVSHFGYSAGWRVVAGVVAWVALPMERLGTRAGEPAPVVVPRRSLVWLPWFKPEHASCRLGLSTAAPMPLCVNYTMLRGKLEHARDQLVEQQAASERELRLVRQRHAEVEATSAQERTELRADVRRLRGEIACIQTVHEDGIAAFCRLTLENTKLRDKLAFGDRKRFPLLRAQNAKLAAQVYDLSTQLTHYHCCDWRTFAYVCDGTQPRRAQNAIVSGTSEEQEVLGQDVASLPSMT